MTIRGSMYIPKFKKGEKVYFIGSLEYRALKRDVPYTVEECIPQSSQYYALKIKTEYGNIISDTPDNFISESEYLKNNNKKNSHDFKAGSSIYYVGPNTGDFTKHHAYKLWHKTDGIFSVLVGKLYKELTKYEIEHYFITEEEYFKQNGHVLQPDSSIVVRGFSPNFKKKFSKGEVVYYIGLTNKMFLYDVPYVVDEYYPEQDAVRIAGVYLPGTDFITREEHKKQLEEIDTSREIKSDVGVAKNEIDIKLQLLKDTKNRILQWTKPYKDGQWYRAIIRLKNPKDAYLRIELTKALGTKKWTLYIYYHRNSKDKKSEDNSQLIKNYSETSGLIRLSKHIEDQISERENLSFQDT